MSFALLANAQDKLNELRTKKQIVTVDNVQAPYYSIQILALKMPPSDANFFRNVNEVKEYRCNDGYVRYCVGSFDTFADANAELAHIKSLGYNEAFVSNTKRFSLKSTEYSSSSSSLNIRPDGSYCVQLSAFRYPVYVTFFEGIDEVYEYRMNDKIFRYTTAPVSGREIQSLLSEVKSKGYKNAFIIDYDKYLPFKIE